MGLGYSDEETPWYASIWVLLVIFIIAALLIVWFAFYHTPTYMTAQRPNQVVVVPGPAGPPGQPGPQGGR